MNPTANGERMSVLRMSVKLIPRLASTGPAVNTRNSTRNGSARTHAAAACCRRVGATCREPVATGGAAAGAGVTTLTLMRSETGADRLGLLLHVDDRDGRRHRALHGLLDVIVDDRRDLLPG